MKRKVTIIILLLFFQCSISNLSFGKIPHFSLNYLDTTKLEKVTEEDNAINEVVKSKTPPKPEKAKYFSEITKYGFKDLFKNYLYNPSIPYSSQVNPNAESFMKDYLQAHGKYLEDMKTTAIPYFNLIDGILTHYGLPKELKYLAVIESDLKSDALSIAGARGPWQFMIHTASDYGLRVDQKEDDRTDYYKSTNAAARYLLNLYKDFNDWLLVIAAYNGGEGRVYSAIKKSGSRNFWNLQYYLPEESRNHVKKFIATHYIMESKSSDSGFDYSSLNAGEHPDSKPNISDEETKNSAELTISGRYNASIIARNLGMDKKDFDRYNPGLDNKFASDGVYDLRLPRDKMDIFIANKYSILNQCVQQLLGDLDVDSKTMYPAKSEIKKGG
jgi:membrane-bound lytic murein transglycosylase D